MPGGQPSVWCLGLGRAEFPSPLCSPTWSTLKSVNSPQSGLSWVTIRCKTSRLLSPPPTPVPVNPQRGQAITGPSVREGPLPLKIHAAKDQANCLQVESTPQMIPPAEGLLLGKQTGEVGKGWKLQFQRKQFHCSAGGYTNRYPLCEYV